METLTFVLIGTILVTNGWFWGGVTEGRSTGAAAGLAAVVLAVATAFNVPDVSPQLAALAALGAVFGAMVALDAYTDTPSERAVGLFSLLLVVVAALVLGSILVAEEAFTMAALGAVVLLAAWLLVFISEGLIPQVEAFRRFAGWATLILGVVALFVGFAPLLDLQLAA